MKKTGILAALLALGVVDGAQSRPASGTRGARIARPRTAYNSDTQSLWEAPAAGTRRHLEEWVSREASHVPLSTYIQDVALPDICLHDSKVGEVLGDRFSEDLKEIENPGFKNGIRAIRALRRDGTDILRVIAPVLRRAGVEVLAGIRMSDTHHRRIDFSEPLCPLFTIRNPGWVIRQPDGRTNETAMDYSVPAVRSHRLAIIEELAERYDLDGVELNFNRWAKHFPRHLGAEKASIMTGYVGQVRQVLDGAAKRRGRSRLVLGVRVPEGIRQCWLAGLDPETWVKQGWVDYLVAAPYNETSPQIPVEQFAAFTKGRCQLLVAMGDQVGGVAGAPPIVQGRGTAQMKTLSGYGGMQNTEAEARACALNYFSWGADGLSFWNVGTKMGAAHKTFVGADPAQQQARLWKWMNAALDRANLTKAPRYYHYLPLHKWRENPAPPNRNYAWYGQGQSPVGTMTTQILRFPESEVGQRKVYFFRMADGRNGEPVKALLRFKVFHLRMEDRLEVDLNGWPIPSERVERIPLDTDAVGLPGLQFEARLESCSRFRGDNELGLILHLPAGSSAVPYLEELEVHVP